MDEAVKWLSYTYLYVRMRLNPMAYGVVYKHMEEDPSLEGYRRKLIVDAGNQLDKVGDWRIALSGWMDGILDRCITHWKDG